MEPPANGNSTWEALANPLFAFDIVLPINQYVTQNHLPICITLTHSPVHYHNTSRALYRLFLCRRGIHDPSPKSMMHVAYSPY